MESEKNGSMALKRFQGEGVTVAEALGQAMPPLSAAGVDTPRLEAQLLLAWALGGARREDLAREPERVLSPREQLMFNKAVALRAERRPLPYITGEGWFYGRSFKLNRAVLIPRPETEMLVEFARERLTGSPQARVADIGTGSGCIAVSLACELPLVSVVAVDLSRLALLVAAKNVKRHAVGSRVELREGDLCAPLAPSERFALIVSNPPYVPATDAPALAPEVRDYEPALALYGGEPWSAAADLPRILRRRLLVEARAHLEPGGWIAVEIGFQQGNEAIQNATEFGYLDIEVRPDFAGIPRVLTARFP